MSVFRMKLPDVGEGVAEAELVEWLVTVGDEVTPETALAEVLTDKATVEVSSPVSGVVSALHGAPGDVLAVGSDLIEIDVAGDEPDAEQQADGTPTEAARAAATEPVPLPPPEPDRFDAPADAPTRRHALAAPAVRARADSLGIDLAEVRGSGPDGRVVHADLDAMLGGGSIARPTSTTRSSDTSTTEPVRGVRRRIADRLTDAWRQIPHITYVDAIDVTELERLRSELNADADVHGVRLTLLPFLATAMAIAVSEQPRINAHYDHANEELTTFDAVHIGVATQTDGGLLVPVVRHAEGRDLWDLAAEIARVTAAARDGSARREELGGSTITITSLGAFGGLATTPILNAPEVAIVGVNKMETRPVWIDGAFQPRRMFNLSSSFDHRMVDGWDAATFVQRLKTLLETPALLFAP